MEAVRPIGEGNSPSLWQPNYIGNVPGSSQSIHKGKPPDWFRAICKTDVPGALRLFCMDIAPALLPDSTQRNGPVPSLYKGGLHTHWFA